MRFRSRRRSICACDFCRCGAFVFPEFKVLVTALLDWVASGMFGCVVDAVWAYFLLPLFPSDAVTFEFEIVVDDFTELGFSVLFFCCVET